MTRAEGGQIGGLVCGFKRKKRQEFLVGFLRMIEIQEFPDLRLSSTLAKKLIYQFTGSKSIGNDILFDEFSIKGNREKHKNLGQLVMTLAERYSEIYTEQWPNVERAIEDEARDYRKSLVDSYQD